MTGTRPFPSSMSSSSPPPPSWPWPSCKHPSTHSFRKGDHKGDGHEVYKGMNSPYFGFGESCFTSSSALASESFSMVSEASSDAIKAAIRGVRSYRLFLDSTGGTRSIVEAKMTMADSATPFEGSVAMAVDSMNPYLDFKLSMEEMVVAHGVVDWDSLEKMLVWYLRMNGKRTHGIIVAAFLDLLISLVSSSSPRSSSSSFSSEIEDARVGHVK